MQTDVPDHELIDEGDKRDHDVGSDPEAAAEGQEQGGVACVYGRMRETHDLIDTVAHVRASGCRQKGKGSLLIGIATARSPPGSCRG